MASVFLTGATGTIGSALVPRLLAEPNAIVRILVRARDELELDRRMAEMRAYWGFRAGEGAANRLQALRGDIALPAFGLPPMDYDQLAGETTHIVHCAASVKLNMTLEQARETAVAPTLTVLRLARECASRQNLRKVDMVSTVGVWGRSPGQMPERPLPEVSEFHNTYEAAKAEAERAIWAAGNELPITVHRPSMVVGERGSGRVIHFQVFYHLCEFLSGVRTFGIMPNLGSTRLDTIPVDWVADAIAWSSQHPETAGRVFHLCSGTDGAIALPQLQQEVRQAWAACGRRIPRLHRVPRHWLERLVPLIGAIAGERTRRALRGLPPVLAYLAEDQSFSNVETAATLAAAGLPVPAVNDYLSQVLDFYLATRSSAGPR